MSTSANAQAALALHRFGMGPRPGSIAAIQSDPRGALIAELDRAAAAEIVAGRPAFERQGFPNRHRRECRSGKPKPITREKKIRTPSDRPPMRPPWRMAHKQRAKWRRWPPKQCRTPGGRSISKRLVFVSPPRSAPDWICRAAGVVLVQSFLRLSRQDQEHVGRL